MRSGRCNGTRASAAGMAEQSSCKTRPSTRWPMRPGPESQILSSLRAWNPDMNHRMGAGDPSSPESVHVGRVSVVCRLAPNTDCSPIGTSIAT